MLSHTLYRIGLFAARRPWTVIGSWLVVTLVVVGASVGFGQELEDSFEVPGIDSQQATDLMAGAGAGQAGLTAQLATTPRNESGTFGEPGEALAGLDRLEADAADLPHVLGTSRAVSADGRVALVTLQYPLADDLDVSDLTRLEDLRDRGDDDGALQVEARGDLFFTFAADDAGNGEVIGIIVAVVILLVAFGSLLAIGLPLGMAALGLGLGISSLSLITYLVEVPSWVPGLGAMIGLGVGIDYALFVLTRHREYLAQGLTVTEAAGRAVATAGRAVLFAGGTVVIAILGLGVAGVPFITAGGIAISVIVLIMVLAAITLLPALLALSGDRISLVWFGRGGDPSTAGSGWQRWVAHVCRHPVVYAVGTTVVLLALAAPALALRIGIPDDGTLPETRTERRAYDLATAGFGAGLNGPLVIAVDTAGDRGIIGPIANAVSADEGVAGISPPEVDAGSGVATVVAYPTTGPQDEATFETVQRLRDEVLPAVLDGSPAKAHVGGQTATFADVGQRVSDRLPYFIAAVLLLSFLLLMVVFRSVLVPLKAALLNLLSIGASYGVMVMVFQWGWGAGLIGVESTLPIFSFIPLFMFAILFGLSMDYEVFLLSRVREEYVATGDNELSVVRGIASTGRVITSAALIMVSVFLGFVLGSDPTIKMFGLGLATAILIDATLVRMVLVPATMKLLGEANWWLPAWLDRLLPKLDDDAALSPVAEPVTLS